MHLSYFPSRILILLVFFFRVEACFLFLLSSFFFLLSSLFPALFLLSLHTLTPTIYALFLLKTSLPPHDPSLDDPSCTLTLRPTPTHKLTLVIHIPHSNTAYFNVSHANYGTPRNTSSV